MDLVTVIPILIAAVVAAIFGHSAYLKRKDKDSLDSASVAIVELRAKLVSFEVRLAALDSKLLSESQVKAMIAEDAREIKGEIKALSELISKLRIDLGVLNYINNRESSRDE